MKYSTTYVNLNPPLLNGIATKIQYDGSSELCREYVFKSIKIKK